MTKKTRRQPSKACMHCGGRLRSKYNAMHELCMAQLEEAKQAAIPVPVPAVKTAWPPSKWCPRCRSVYNGLYVYDWCCGAATEAFGADLFTKRKIRNKPQRKSRGKYTAQRKGKP